MTLYIHFPFCKSRCIYCDFFSTVGSPFKSGYVERLCRELDERGDYIPYESVSSIYLGGGTPSLFSPSALRPLFSAIREHFIVMEGAEITMELNPDDLTPAYLQSLNHELPVNRLSMGVQSFNDRRLQFLRRRHSPTQAIRAVSMAREAGFTNISIDLMYGFPDEGLDDWLSDVRQALQLGVPHLSAYALMTEEGTPLYDMMRNGDVKAAGEETVRTMYDALVSTLADAGYVHYEISNFCQPGMHSRHNSAYWNGSHYLGLGAGAHSYNGRTRDWNPSSLEEYMMNPCGSWQERCREQIDDDTRYNEWVMTSLRTSSGINLDDLADRLGEDRLDYLLAMARKHLEKGTMEITAYKPLCENEPCGSQALRFTPQGVFISDSILADLMRV